jgi:hypothetical protein
MADKLQQGISVLTSFTAGETPTSEKLSSITAQLRRAAEQLERAVGDIHDQSYPYSTSTTARLAAAYGRVAEDTPVSGALTRSLDIANIARLIGPASNLNPEAVGGARTVTEDVPSDVNEFALKYPPSSTASISFTKNGAAEAFYDSVSSPTGLDAEGDYHVDSAGRVWCVKTTDSTDPGEVTYTIDPDEWRGGPNYLGARFNVIPDPNQMSGGSGCAVGALDANGRRPVTCPTISHAQFNDDMDTSVLSSSDANYGQQLKLPLVITEAYSVGEVIPAGFLLLKNWTTGEVYSGAEYLYNGETSVLVGAVDITTEVDRGDQFVLVTVGTDITGSIDDLRRKMGHTHDRSFGEPLVDLDGIGGFTAGPWGSKGSFTKSNVKGNFAPQYLHRYGYASGEGDWNDKNAMRGHLLVGEGVTTPGTYVSASGAVPATTTYKVAFGHPDNAWMYLTSGGDFRVENALTTGGVTLASGAQINLIATTSGFFQFNDQALWTYARDCTWFLEDSTGGASDTHATFRVANNGNGGDDGWFQVGGLGYSYKYSDSSTAAGVGVNDSTSRQYWIETDSVPGYTSNPATLFQEVNPGAKGIMELYWASIPGNAFYYMQFRGNNASPQIYGSIRGTDLSSDPVFFSRHSSNYDYCDEVGGAGAVTAQAAGHVKYVSGGADYGEWLRAGDVAEWAPYFEKIERKTTRLGLPEGLVVYVREGLFYAQGPGTPMVITNRAIVVGNEQPGLGPVAECEVLSFIGQIPVMCYGVVADGDLLIPNPAEPNTLIAVPADEITFAQYRQAVGTAWGSSDHAGLKKVQCAIGKK